MKDMNELDDAGWDALMEQLDLDVTDLRAAEARLQQGGEAPLSPAMAEAMVRDATRVVPLLRLRARRVQRWSRVAAMVLGAALLTAGIVFLLWPWARDSRDTMTYRMQLQLLESSDQPVDHRRTAMAWVASRVGRSVFTLQAIRDDVVTPPALAEGARLGLGRLLTLLAVEPPQRLNAYYENLDLAGERARDPSLAPALRALELERLILGAGSEIGAMRTMPAMSPVLGKDRDRYLSGLQRWLMR